jgi:glycosyltransferase involved in cell wall biosynthesis
VVIGFGGWREGFERLLVALAAGDRDTAREIAAAGRELEGGPRAPLRHLLAFLDAAPEAYWSAARGLPERVVMTGRLEHDELAPVLAGCEALVFPSTFPEAFGMVAAEAAACGVLPLSADHSGLAEVTAALREAVPAPARDWLSFAVDDGAVEAIAQRLVAWLLADEELRATTRAALVEVARARYSWEGVADGVIAAAQGRHDALARPA